jgi:REP element-mobilizing transposase RayT
MKNDLPERKDVRFKHFDYGTPTYYFVTVCTAGREHLLGEITAGNVGVALLGDPFNVSYIELSTLGKIVLQNIEYIDKNFGNYNSDYFCIMPNHIHLLIRKLDVSYDLEHGSPRSATPTNPHQTNQTVPQLINAFKSITSKQAGFSFWQRNYYEHIIRNEAEINEIRKYIEENPAKWEEDKYFLR